MLVFDESRRDGGLDREPEAPATYRFFPLCAGHRTPLALDASLNGCGGLRVTKLAFGSNKVTHAVDLQAAYEA